VLNPPPEIPIEVAAPLANQEVTETEDATFTCKLSKVYQVVTWGVKGKDVSPGDKYIMKVQEDEYRLTIKDCTLEDMGVVTIETKDCKSKAQLTVNGGYLVLLEFYYILVLLFHDET